MRLSDAKRQNITYFCLVLGAILVTIPLYFVTQKEWVVYREAETNYNNKEYALSIPLYERSLELGVQNWKATLHLANAYVSIGNFKEAIKLYRIYLAKHPNDNKIRLELAKALGWEGEFKESKKEFHKILDEKND